VANDTPAADDGPRARRRWDSAATKARLLEAAENEFAAYGFAGTCVDDIARRADANVQAIYRYFGGKAGLHRAAFDSLYGDVARRIQEAAAAAPLDDLTPRERFAAMAGLFFDTVWEHPTFARFALWALAEGTLPNAPCPQGAGLQTMSGMGVCNFDAAIAEGALKPGTTPMSVMALQIPICIGQYGLAHAQHGQEPKLDASSPAVRARLRAQLGEALLAVFGA
jgi:AcrR family transcriptional regulator